MNIPSKYMIATAAQAQQVDEQTINDVGIEGFTLMEIAGKSAADHILAKIAPQSHGIFLCGKGNNGGDALVAARYLVQHDIGATIIFVGGTDDLSPLAKKNYTLLKKINQNDANVHIKWISEWEDANPSINADFIVDGMLGTGLISDVREKFLRAIQWANKSNAPIFAMDIPTGLHADTGQIMGDAIKATHTYAFGMFKQGFYLNDGLEHAGKIQFCELPFPNYVKASCTSYLMSDSYLSQKSSPPKHKYEKGVLYIIAGSEGLTGAAMLAAKSAWGTGVGAVILVCPRGILPIFENNLPQIIKKPVGKNTDSYFKDHHLEQVLRITQEKDGTVLIGPGLGRKETTSQFATQFVSKTTKNTVIDADALWALSQQNNWENTAEASWILTPHPGELSSLLDTTIANDFDRLTKAKKIAEEKNILLLAKGFPVILGTPSGKIFVSDYDSRIFSRAGFGDVLAGKIAGFNTLKYPPVESCIKALIDGQKKATSLTKNTLKSVEPLDLI